MKDESTPPTPPEDSRRTSRSTCCNGLREPRAGSLAAARGSLPTPGSSLVLVAAGVAAAGPGGCGAGSVRHGIRHALPTFRHSGPTDSFRGWLHGLTRSIASSNTFVACVARSRPHRRLRRPSRLLLEQPHLPLEPDEEENNLCGQLYRRALEFIRGEFEARTWQMFWRSVIDGLATATVAAELSASSASVRQARSPRSPPPPP